MTNWQRETEKKTDPRTMEWYDVAGQAVMNLPKSGYEYITDILQALVHPVETGKAMGRLAIGAAEKVLPRGAVHMLPGPSYNRTYEDEFDGLIDFYKNRYGTIEDFKKALAEDPIGVMGDGATFLSGAGLAVRGLGVAAKSNTLAKLGKVGEITQKAAPGIEKAARMMQRTGAAMEPVQAVGAGFGLLEKAVPKIRGMTLAERMYESAVKWNTSMKKPGKMSFEVRQALTKTALENKIMPTYKGMRKLRDKLDVLSGEIDNLARGASGTVDAGEMLRHFKDLEKKIWETSGQPGQAIHDIRKIRKQFIMVHGVFEDLDGFVSHPLARSPGDIPRGKLIGFERLSPEAIQNKKITIYQDLENFYEKAMSSPASVKAQKAIARGAKEMLNELIPELKKVNKNYGPIKELYNALDQKAARITNYNIFRADAAWKATAGYAATGGTGAGAGAGLAFSLLDAPVVKSKLALLIHHMKGRTIKVSPTKAALALGLFQTGREAERQEESTRADGTPEESGYLGPIDLPSGDANTDWEEKINKTEQSIIPKDQLELGALYEDAEGNRKRYIGGERQWAD